MSCDWNVHCLDCKVTHGFDDANHQQDLMLFLCKHADSIAALAEMAADQKAPCGPGDRSVTLETPYGRIDPTWFREHLGHNLIPIDEYGAILGQCHEWVRCKECGSTSQCALDAGHEDPHSQRRPGPAAENHAG